MSNDQERDMEIAKLALREKFVTREQVRECFLRKRKKKIKKPLSYFLFKSGYIDEDQLHYILKIIKKRIAERASSIADKPLKLPFFTLTIIDGDETLAGRQFKFSLDSALIGTNPDNNIVIPDEEVSKHHAIIESLKEGLQIRDLGSLHGTFLNGERVVQAKLKAGDTIKIGAYSFRIDYTFPLSRKIVILKDHKKFNIKRQDIRIGRHPQSEIHLSDSIISRDHAIIQVNADGSILVQDKDSTIGTLVNNIPVKSHILQDQDQIIIGFHEIMVYITEDTLKLKIGQLKDDTKIGIVKEFINKGKFIPRLAKFPIFMHLSRGDIRDFINTLTTIKIPVGSIIIREGECSETFFLIIQGTAEGFKATENGDASYSKKFGAGDLLGEESILSGSAHPLTVKISSEATLLVFPKHEIIQFIRSSPEAEEWNVLGSHKETIYRILCTLPIFKDVEEPFINLIADQSECITFNKGDVLIDKGEVPESLFYLRSGFVSATKKGKKKEFYFRPGDYFGENSIYEPTPYPWTLKVDTAFAELIKINKGVFKSLFKESPHVPAKIKENIKAWSPDIYTDGKSDRILVLDPQKCNKCGKCIEVCHENRDASRMSHSGPDMGEYKVVTSCGLCQDPVCLLCYFQGAIYKRHSDEVDIKNRCTGCGLCVSRCPWKNLSINISEPKKQIAVICDRCSHISEPYCVKECPTKALKFISVSKMLKKKDADDIQDK